VKLRQLSDVDGTLAYATLQPYDGVGVLPY